MTAHHHHNRLLIADDDPIGRAFLADNLAADGYNPMCAEDADAALHLLARQFDGLLVDVNGGTLAVIDTVRNAGRASVDPMLPIVALTSHREEHHRLRLLDRGADDVLAKPYSYPELRSRLAALLRRANARRAPQLLSAGSLRLEVDARRVWVGET